jgi:hypothetical protein
MKEMTKMKTFTTTLGADEKGSIALVELPFDPREAFGKARAPVKITINGVVLRSTVMVYGGKPYIGFRREIREEAKLAAGMKVTIRIEADTAPRVVEAPPDLKKALKADAAAKTAWEALSFTHQKEHVQALLDAKKPETRATRLTKTLQMLKTEATSKVGTKTKAKPAAPRARRRPS